MVREDLSSYNLQVGNIGDLVGTPILESVELAPSVINETLYNSMSNRDNIVIANTGCGTPINIDRINNLNTQIKYSGTIGSLDHTQNGSSVDITFNNMNLTTAVKDVQQAAPAGISGQYLPNHTGNVPTVQGRRILFPLIVTWKVQEIPDLKAAIWSNDMQGKMAGETFTINCSVKNLTDSTVNTYYGASLLGQGWNPPSEYYVSNGDVGPDNINFSFQVTMPSQPTIYYVAINYNRDRPAEEADWS